MSSLVDLAGMLADPNAAGAYFVDASDGREAIADAAARLEFFHVQINLDGCSDKDAVLEAIARALKFPDWFGRNWDALADSLDDLSWLPADGYVVLLDHAGQWRKADPAGFDVLMDIGNEAARRWAEHGVPFWWLVLSPPGAVRAARGHAEGESPP